jgi:hypothetical protein
LNKETEVERSLLLLFATSLAASLAGCAKDPLDAVEKAAGKYQACMVKRTYKDECRRQEDDLETARLQAVKAGSEPVRIEAARSLGFRGVAGAVEDSPYTDFMKRRKEAIATHLIRANREQLEQDEALANTIQGLSDKGQPLTSRQQAEMLLIQSMLEEKYPAYFSEPPNGIEADPEILGLVCKQGSKAMLAQACKRFRQR